MKKNFRLFFSIAILEILPFIAFAQNTNVFIHGKVNGAELQVVLRSMDIFLQEDVLFAHETSGLDSTFVLKTFLAYPQEMMILNAPVFLTPGDSIHLETDGNYVTSAKGKNSSNYLILSSIKRNRLPIPALEEKYTKDWLLYKQDILSHHKSSVQRQKVLIDSLSPTDELKAYISEKSDCKYISDLISVTNNRVRRQNLPNKYIDAYESDLIERFMDTTALSNSLIANAIWQDFMSNYLNFNEEPSKSPEINLKQTVSIATEKIHSDMLGKIILSRLHRYYFSARPNYNDVVFNSVYNLCVNNLRNSVTHLAKLELLRSKILAKESQLSDMVLNTNLLDVDGVSHKLKDMLPSDQIYVIDFWASWCGPCLQDRMDGVATLSYFKEFNVNVLSLSIDKSKNAWKNSLKKTHLNFNELLITDYKNSPLIKRIALSGIPRTALYQNGRILVMDCPRLSNSFEWFKILNMLRKQ